MIGWITLQALLARFLRHYSELVAHEIFNRPSCVLVEAYCPAIFPDFAVPLLCG